MSLEIRKPSRRRNLLMGAVLLALIVWLADSGMWSSGVAAQDVPVPETASVAAEHYETLPGESSGHVHPGVRLQGKGKQSLSLPCFHFTEKQCIMPAFGEFTGKFIIKPNGKDRVYVIAKSNNEQVVMKVDKN